MILDPAEIEKRSVPAMKAGSAVVYLGSTLHGGGHNATTDQWRRGMHVSYVVGWLRTEENNYLSLWPDLIHTLPRRSQELLGFGAHDAVMNGGGYLGTTSCKTPSNSWRAASCNSASRSAEHRHVRDAVVVVLRAVDGESEALVPADQVGLRVEPPRTFRGREEMLDQSTREPGTAMIGASAIRPMRRASPSSSTRQRRRSRRRPRTRCDAPVRSTSRPSGSRYGHV